MNLTQELVAMFEGREMGFLGFIGKGLKAIGKGLVKGLKVAGKVAPFAAMAIPGVGPALGGALGAIGSGASKVLGSTVGGVLKNTLGGVLGVNSGGVPTGSSGGGGGVLQNMLGGLLGQGGSNILPAALGGIGGALANRDEKYTVNPNLTPGMTALRDQIIGDTMGLGNTSGILANQISGINRSRDLQRQNTEEINAMRGISGPAATNSVNAIDDARFSDIIKAKNGLPLLKAQLLSQQAGILNQVPTGQTTTVGGNKLGGAFNEISQFLLDRAGYNSVGGPAPAKPASAGGGGEPPNPELDDLIRKVISGLPSFSSLYKTS